MSGRRQQRDAQGAGSQMRFIASARGVRANAVWLAAPLDLAGAGWMAPAHAQDAVCAEVKIETKQKLSLEGQSLEAPTRGLACFSFCLMAPG